MATNNECPMCGASLSADADRCPKCRAEIRSKQSYSGPPHRAPQVTKCPRCGASIQRGDVICVACGTNLLTGKRVTVSSASSELPAGRSFEDFKPWLWAGAGVFAAVVLIACVFILFFRDYTAIGKRLLSEGNYEQAADHFRTATERNKPSYDAYFYLGITQSLMGYRNEAINSFKKAVQLEPDSADAHLLLGLTYGMQKNIPSEITELERVMALQKNNIDVLLLLALAYGLNNEPDLEVLSLHKALDINSADPKIHYYLGLALSRQEKYDAAIAEYQQAIQLGLDSVGNAHLALGLTYQAGGSVEQALTSLHSALQEQTQFPQDGHFHLGLALAAKGNWQQARDELAQAAEAGASNAAASYFLGTAENTLGNQAAATAAFNRVIELGDSEYGPKSHIQLALIKLKQGDSALAENELQKAIDAQPNDVTARVQLGMLLKRQTGREAEAIKAFRSAIDIAPTNPAPHLAFAIYYVERKNPSAAISEFKQYLALAPSGAESDAVRRIVDQLQKSAQT
ncbi:MAG: tetratricopeptide repeat protein [Candidatus Hydrogenedentes bacterium]|nr:tetratricopeptide repeat protein [Candidatus Hydrogenedentota bacterium]